MRPTLISLISEFRVFRVYDFLGGVMDLLYKRKTTGRRPTTPQKSKSKIFRRTQIGWVIWRSSMKVEALGERLRGNTIRGNRPKRFSEGNLPLRGSLRGRFSEDFRFLEVLRGFQRFWEVFSGFQRFFKGPLRDPLRVPSSSQSCGPCCP